MPGGWVDSTRRDRLPRDWHRRRAVVRKRDGYRCTAVLDDVGARYYAAPVGTRCPGGADHVDHVVPDSAGGTDEESNLASLCAWHHGRKSSAEGNAARWSAGKRPVQRHPGLL